MQKSAIGNFTRGALIFIHISFFVQELIPDCHNGKRHKDKKEDQHVAKTVPNNGDPQIAIPIQPNKENHAIETMADVFAFLEENPTFANIWEDRMDIEVNLV